MMELILKRKSIKQEYTDRSRFAFVLVSVGLCVRACVHVLFVVIVVELFSVHAFSACAAE